MTDIPPGSTPKNAHLVTETGKTVVWCFGRMNPPHYGHEGVIKTLQQVAAGKNADWRVFVSKSHDAKKNPLSYTDKVQWLYALFPQTKQHVVEDPEIRTFMQAAAYLYQKGYRSAVFVAGEDDMPGMKKTLEDYNGKQVAHGFYNFQPLSFVTSPRLTSATNAREAAKANNPEAFELATRVKPDVLVNGKTLFQAVRAGMGLNVSVEENFKDGRHPEDKGDAKRHGVPTKASVSTLRKVAKQGGRKGQLAHWMANMKAGKKRASESKLLDKSTPSVAQLMKKYSASFNTVMTEIRRGIKVEMEHTKDAKVASEIARDHLNEKLDYYKLLKKIEIEGNMQPGNTVIGNRDTAVNPFDRYTPFMDEDVQLDEVSLKKINSFANDPFLDNVNLAWELEMIWPNHDDGRHEDDDYDEGDREADYDADESIDTRDFDSFSTDVMNFFRGDYNSRSDVRDALDSIKENYNEWLIEQWNELDDEEKEEEYGGNETRFIDAKWDDEFEGWCENEGLGSMSDLPSYHGVYLTWPHYTEPERYYREKGELTRDDLRDMFIRQFGTMLEQDGFKVIAWDHPSKDKEPDTWYIEPDGSLNAEDPEDGGVEITSPIIKYHRSLEYLNKMFAWAKSNGAYTGSDYETGMHLNLSLPKEDMDRIDWVKLILMGGDDRVLRDFDRWANGDFGWAHSALKKMKQLAAAQQPMTPDAVINIISNELSPEARREASNLISGNKYMSVHPKGKSPGGNFGYVEFRSAGGDTLANLDKVKTAALQYARSLYIASNPEVEKREYASKLLRLFAKNKNGDAGMDAFRDYVAGKIDIKNLKYRLIQRAKARGQEPKATVSGHEYGLTNKETKDKIFVVADSLTDAVPQMYRQAIDKNSNQYALGQWKVDLQGDEKVYRVHGGRPGGDSAEYRLVVIANSDKEAIDAAKKRLGDDLEYNARDVYLPDLGDLWNLLQNGRQDRDPAERAAAKAAAAPPKTMGPIINLKTGEPRPAFTEPQAPQAQQATAPQAAAHANNGPGTYIITYLPPIGNEQKTAYDANSYQDAVQMFRLQHPISYQITDVEKENETQANESLFDSLMTEDEVDEVKMAPGTLAKFAKTPVAKDIRVGWEAEMFLPDLEEDDPEAQLDMSVDEPIPFGERNWMENIYRFWQNADGNTHSRREIENAINDMMEIWYDHISYEFDRYLGTKAGYDEIEETIKEQNPDIEDAEVSYAIIDRDEKWDNAIDTMRERFDEQMNYDAEEFRDAMRSQNIRNYSDFSRRFGLDWPYYDYNAGGMSYETLVSDFVDATGYPAKFGRYSEKPDDTTGVFKEDGSLRRGDLPSNYSGIEFASAYRPLDDSVEMLNKFWKWAGNLGGETNESCGFHMGISIPDHTAESVDVLKFVLFLGDNKVLEDFGRQSNRWAKSTIDNMRNRAQGNSYRAEQSLQAFREGLNSLAAQAAKRAVLHIPGEQGGDRYLSVNYKSNYIEVRSAGGDYFNMKDKILETMNRYVRVLALASDPEAEKNEYYKKLYDVLSSGEKQVSYYDPKDPKNQKNVTKTVLKPQPGYRQFVDTKLAVGDKDAIKLFARYVTQGLPKAALKSYLRNIQWQRRAAKDAEQTQAPAGSIPANLANDDNRHLFVVRQIDGAYITQRQGTYAEVIRWLEDETRDGFDYNLWLADDSEHRYVGRVDNGTFIANQPQPAQRPAVANQIVYNVLRRADGFKVHEFSAASDFQARQAFERWARNWGTDDYIVVRADQQEPEDHIPSPDSWEPEPEPVHPNDMRSFRVTFMYNSELGSATVRGTSRQDAIARFYRENPGAELRSMADLPAQSESTHTSIFDAILEEEEKLDEVVMNPSAFKAFLGTPAAQQMTMGFEAEMCVKNLSTGQVRLTPRMPPEEEMAIPYPFDTAGRAKYYDFWSQNNANTRRSITFGLKRLDRWMEQWMQRHAAGQEITPSHWARALSGGNYRNWTNMYQVNDLLELKWPYGHENNRMSVEDLKNDFQNHTGFGAVIFDRYHGGSKPKDKFVFEPDNSIRPKSGDGAQELVSYAMPLPQAIDALNKMFAWANEKGYVYTNASTGFHVNVGMGLNTPDNIDQLKLLLLLGDQKLLKDFERDANTYCESMMKRLDGLLRRSNQANRDELLNALRSKTWDGLRKVASRFVERAQSGDKFVSVNNKGKYIEFRGPGGDWMNNQDKLRNTIIQVSRAYAMAADRTEGQQDYLKKAYKLLSSMGEQKDDRLKVFVDWTMGKINQSELLNQLQRRQGRPATRQPAAAQQPVDTTHMASVIRALPPEYTQVQPFTLYDDDTQDEERSWSGRSLYFVMSDSIDISRMNNETTFSLYRDAGDGEDPIATFSNGDVEWRPSIIDYVNRQSTRQQSSAGNNDRHYYGLTTLDGRTIASYAGLLTQDEAIRWATSRQGSGDLPVLLVRSDGDDLDNSITVGSVRNGNFMPATGQQPAATGFTRPSQDLEIENLIAQLPREMTIAQSWTIRNIEGEEVEDFTDTAADAVAYLRDYSSDSPNEEFYLQADNTHTDEGPYNFASAGAGRVDLFGAQEYARQQGHSITAHQPAQQQPAAQPTQQQPAAQATPQPATRNILMVAHSDGHGDFMHTPVNATTAAQARSIFQREYGDMDIYDVEPYDPEIHGDLDTEPLHESTELDEVTQNPTVWDNFLASPAAKKIIMGFEAEMCVKDMSNSIDIGRGQTRPLKVSNKAGRQAFMAFWSKNDANTEEDIKAAIKYIQEVMRENYFASYLHPANYMHELLEPYWQNRINLKWPYQLPDQYTRVQFAKDFTTATGYKVNVGESASKDSFGMEEDGSIDAKIGDSGVELISYPMPLPQAMEAVNKTYSFLKDGKRAYTNSSTGFHINVSMAGKSLNNIDQLKLLLLMGDNAILEEFGRKTNQYCESMLKRLRDVTKAAATGNDRVLDKYNGMWDGGIGSIDHVYADVLPKMRGETWKGLKKIANEIMSQVHDMEKYVTVNIHDNYIEFRGAGGNWLNKWDQIYYTVLRVTHAYTLAADPKAGQQDYLKKLYKVMTAYNQGDDQLKLWTDFTLGTVSAEQLKQKLTAKHAAARKIGPVQPKPNYVLMYYTRANNERELVRFYAANEAEAQKWISKFVAANPRVRNLDYYFTNLKEDAVAEGKLINILVAEESKRKPKKPKTIIDGAMKTLMNKGRSEDEAIADLKKEIDRKFYTEAADKPIKFLDGELEVGDHFKQRRTEPDRMHVSASFLVDLITRAKLQWERTLRRADDEDFVIKKTGNPLGVVLKKRRRPDGSAYYNLSTYHPTLNINANNKILVVEDNEPGFRQQEPYKVYLDMDGVLADFFGEWSRLSGVDHYKDIDNVEAKLQLIREHPTFWTNLPVLPHAKELIRTVIQQFGEYHICSKPLDNDPRSGPGKRAWIQMHLQDMPPASIVLTHNKAEFATDNGSPNILVDDYGVNISSWRAAGGIGLHYEDTPSRSNISDIKRMLMGFAKTGKVK